MPLQNEPEEQYACRLQTYLDKRTPTHEMFFKSVVQSQTLGLPPRAASKEDAAAVVESIVRERPQVFTMARARAQVQWIVGLVSGAGAAADPTPEPREPALKPALDSAPEPTLDIPESLRLSLSEELPMPSPRNAGRERDQCEEQSKDGVRQSTTTTPLGAAKDATDAEDGAKEDEEWIEVNLCPNDSGQAGSPKAVTGQVPVGVTVGELLADFLDDQKDQAAGRRLVGAVVSGQRVDCGFPLSPSHAGANIGPVFAADRPLEPLETATTHTAEGTTYSRMIISGRPRKPLATSRDSGRSQDPGLARLFPRGKPGSKRRLADTASIPCRSGGRCLSIGQGCDFLHPDPRREDSRVRGRGRSREHA